MDAELRSILEDLIASDGPCDHWDHHGYCQTHWLDEKDNCPIARAIAYLENHKEEV